MIAWPGEPKTLLIAMAGPHQIWKLNLETKTVSVWAGNGYEDIRDGSLTSASFAQPSALTTDGNNLYVADSEGSCIRIIDLKGGKVATLVGMHDVPGVLFSFGDVDGRGPKVRLQHCLGLTYHDGKLYIADTYNNKVKVCDIATREVKTLAGSRQAGSTDKPAQFDEPGGVSVADDTLYIADTNNHKIRTISLNEQTVSTLSLDGVKPPSPPRRPPSFPNPTVLNASAVTVAPGEGLTLKVDLKVPDGYKLSPDAPMPYLLEAPESPAALGRAVSPTGGRVDPPAASFNVDVPLAQTAKAGDQLRLKLSVSAFLCKTNGSLCEIHSYVWNVPVTFGPKGAERVELTNVDRP